MALAALLLDAAHAQQAAPLPGASLDENIVVRLRPVDVTVNGAAVGNWLLLDRNGDLYVTPEAFDEWRLQRGRTGQPFAYRGQTWYPLAAIPGFSAEFDAADQSMKLRFAPDAFAATRLVQPTSTRPALTPSIPSGFFSYDLSFTRAATRGATPAQDLGGLFELGTSGNWGVLTSTFLARNIMNANPLDNPRLFRRLETAYIRDFPDSDITLKVGDSTTRAASWGRSVFFGGVQIGRNFGLTPGFITQPLPIISGVSSTPSTVELYINDALRQTSQVPAGPFAIDNFPLITGPGQARMVVRDVLGRETVIVQDFFSHANLLEKGLTDWSIEAGAVRNQLGIRATDYDRPFISGLFRRGFTKELTLESKLELGRRTQNAGVGVVTGLPFQLLGQLGIAASRNERAGGGQLWQASLTRTSAYHGFSFNYQGAKSAYRQIGQDDASPSFRQQWQASYNYQTQNLGALGLGLALIDSVDRGRILTYNANYSVQVRNATVTLSAVHVSDPSYTGGGSSVGVSVFVPLGPNLNSSSNLTHHGGRTEGYVSVSKGLETAEGLSWRALGGVRENEPFAEGGLYLQGSKTLTTLDVAQSRTQQTMRLGVQGTILYADQELFATRRLSDSYAVVEVPGYADIGIRAFGNIVARTDARGRAIVSPLQPYQANDIRLDPSELPINAELQTIEQRAVPSSRSAVKIVFPVRSGRGALVRIVFPDGEPAPAGAPLEVVGDKEEFFVARRGEAFLTGLQERNEVKLHWNDQTCVMTVNLPPGKPDDIARVGPVLCAGVQR